MGDAGHPDASSERDWERLLALDAERVWHPYGALPASLPSLPVVSAEGVRLRLADGRELWASRGHRTADGRPLGGLAAGETLDGSRIVLWELVPYS